MTFHIFFNFFRGQGTTRGRFGGGGGGGHVPLLPPLGPALIQVSLVTSLTTYVISPIVIKVSVLSNLRLSGCELKDNYYVSFT